MEEKIIIEKLKNAIERATKNVIMINSFNSYIPFGSTEGEEIFEYFEQFEALVKAMNLQLNL
jgi:archaellum biogenesis ATPase FlaH